LKNRFLDSALLRSPLGTPYGGNDTNKHINYAQLVLALCKHDRTNDLLDLRNQLRIQGQYS